jgi:hypothetical protein
MIEQKKVDLDKGREALTHLDEVPNPVVSARQFIILNFDTLQKSGKTLKALHHFLTDQGIDIGTFESFRSVYNSVKRARKLNAQEPASKEQGKPAAMDAISWMRFSGHSKINLNKGVERDD